MHFCLTTCTRVLTFGVYPPVSGEALVCWKAKTCQDNGTTNKKQLTVWRHEKDMDVLREVAKQNDISMSELMEILIEDFQTKKKVDQARYLRNKRKN